MQIRNPIVCNASEGSLYKQLTTLGESGVILAIGHFCLILGRNNLAYIGVFFRPGVISAVGRFGQSEY